jgi:hypothetical protein
VNVFRPSASSAARCVCRSAPRARPPSNMPRQPTDQRTLTREDLPHQPRCRPVQSGREVNPLFFGCISICAFKVVPAGVTLRWDHWHRRRVSRDGFQVQDGIRILLVVFFAELGAALRFRAASGHTKTSTFDSPLVSLLPFFLPFSQDTHSLTAASPPRGLD